MIDQTSVDRSYGAGQTVTDLKVVSSGIHITSFTPAITASTADLYAPVKLQVYRNASDALDTFTADARLIGVTIIKS
jgi:hypothetical protein